jgi:hypothetical protein
MDPDEWNMAIASGVGEISQHQRQVLVPTGLDCIPVNLEGAVCGWKHGRDHPAYPLRFDHLAKPYTVMGARSCSGLSRDCGESRHFGTGSSGADLAPTSGACLI